MKKIITVVLVVLLSFSAFSAELIKDTGSVNKFDRALMRPYNKGLDTVGDVLMCTSMAAAGVLAFEDSSEYLTIGTMYLETLGLTYGVNELAKLMISRDRPFTYYDNAPVSEIDNWNKSCPSRHSALAFSAASFTSFVFCKYNPDSKYKIPVIAGTTALAVATSVMRVASGNHFTTDVLLGAAIGTAIGIGIPLLHTIGSNTNAEVAVSPFALAFKLNF